MGVFLVAVAAWSLVLGAPAAAAVWLGLAAAWGAWGLVSRRTGRGD